MTTELVHMHVNHLHRRIDPLELYSVSETMAILKVKRDKAIQIISDNPHVDLGTRESMHRRKKRMLRWKGADLLRYIGEHTS